MKRVSLLCAVAAAALTVGSARADVFNFSFNGGAVGFSGSGSFNAMNDGGGEYTIQSLISGTVTDPFLGTLSITGLDSTFGPPDNDLFSPGANPFDYDGFSFDLSDGLAVNLYSDQGVNQEVRSDGQAELLTSETVTPAAVAATPEPSSFVLLGSAALMGIGDVVRRRRSAA
ncbi:MAG TPA: hypothetical protein VKV02_06300 [Acidobacteriaceae bacterium]|nr:hypothetical protein [Acidobacteriaceae bacterium]